MKRHGSFEQLSKNLSHGERKNFLNKVESHLDNKPVPIVPSANHLHGKKQVEAIDKKQSGLSQDLQHLTGFRRLSLRLLAYFRSKTLEETFLEVQLDELRRRLQGQRQPKIASTTGAINPIVAESLHPVYLKVKLLRRLLHYLWSNNSVMESYYNWCIISDYGDHSLKNKITDLVEEKEIKEAILQPGEETVLRRKIGQTINRYLETVSNKFIENIKCDLLPLFYLRALFQFPFQDFFQMFGCSDPNTTVPQFTSCPSEACCADLLKLYSISQLLEGLMVHKEGTLTLLSFAISTASNESDLSKLDNESKQVYAKLEECFKLWQEFSQNIPLWDLVLYSHKDIYFSHALRPPVLQLKPLIIRSFRTELLNQFDKLWKETAILLVKDSEAYFIKDLNETKLIFYWAGSSVDARRFGSFSFKHFHSIELSHNFLLRFYPRNLRPLLLSIIKVVPKRLPLQQRLIAITNGYENILRQIKEFDASLAPETDRGKRLSNIMYRLEKGDVNAKVPLNELVQSTDGEANYLIDKFIANLAQGAKILSEVLTSDADIVQQYLENIAPHPTIEKRMSQLVSEAASKQQEFSNFLSYEYQQEKL